MEKHGKNPEKEETNTEKIPSKSYNKIVNICLV